MDELGHLSGQIAVQEFMQFNKQLFAQPQHIGNSLRAQMRSLGPQCIDPELVAGRNVLCGRIYKILQRGNRSCSNDLLQLPKIARYLEERLFTAFMHTASKEEYLNLVKDQAESHLSSLLKDIIVQKQLSLGHITSSSLTSIMIPTPGVRPNGSSNTNPPPDDTDIVSPTAANTGNLIPTTCDLADIRNNSSFKALDGMAQNGYQLQDTNSDHASCESSTRPSLTSIDKPKWFMQTLQTPEFNNSVSMETKFSSATDSSSSESTMIPTQQQQKKYVGRQNSYILDSLGVQMVAGTRSNTQHVASSYGFSTELMNEGLGLISSEMQLDLTITSDRFHSMTPYSSPLRPPQQHFSRQHHQPFPSTASLYQQRLPIADDDYLIMAADVEGYEAFHGSGSSNLFSSSNTASLHSKSATQSGILHHGNLQSMQHPSGIRVQILDHQRKINLEKPHSANDDAMKFQQQMKQSRQQPDCAYTQFVQDQHQLQQKSQFNQQLMLENDVLRHSSVISNANDKLLTENSVVTQSKSLQQQAAHQGHVLEIQSCYPQNTYADGAKSAHSLGHYSVPQDFHVPIAEDSQQLLHLFQQADQLPGKAGFQHSGSQTDEFSQVQWQPQSLQKALIQQKRPGECIKEDLPLRITRPDEVQRTHMSSGPCITSSDAKTMPQFSNIVCRPEDSVKEQNYYKYRRYARLLCLLYHVSHCSALNDQCKQVNCTKGQELCKHMKSCKVLKCAYPLCYCSRLVFNHFHHCQEGRCPVCAPLRTYTAATRKAHAHVLFGNSLVSETKIGTDMMRPGTKPNETVDDKQSSPKRRRVQHPLPSLFSKHETSPVCITMGNKPHVIEGKRSQVCEQTDTNGTCDDQLSRRVQHALPSLVSKNETSPVSITLGNQPPVIQEAEPQVCEQTVTNASAEVMVIDMKVDQFIGSAQENLPNFGSIIDGKVSTARCDVDPAFADYVDCHIELRREKNQANIEDKPEANDPPANQVTTTKSGKQKINGVSLTEFFTPERIREHIAGLRKPDGIGQGKAKAKENQGMSENSCQLCGMDKLTFEPLLIYCSICHARIRRNKIYYTNGNSDPCHNFCILCYNEARGDSMIVDGSTFQKSKLQKNRNDKKTEEWWVQCDKCEVWQHQICALFNGRRNEGGHAEYTCPFCYIKEVEKCERKPLPKSAVLGAKDLPKSFLSDHIEARLSRRLKEERIERARGLGKMYEEVPGAERLVVRVVSSVDKKLEVTKRFLDLLQEENYPKEFPYKSKAILLFQEIEGVEVCLFGMFVQEFGSKCSIPNQRHVYLSYLDSVKYFRPKIKSVTGEALRTFVYHEILIGYLEYCKIRGFTSLYIWACPPRNDEDYILYCHPKIQKMPKSDKLKEWYLAMIQKAAREKIVVDVTNLYDNLFVTMGESKAKLTAARLPYFEGDFWPGEAEGLINQLCQEEDGRKEEIKGTRKRTTRKTALKPAGLANLSSNALKDSLFMQKLGEIICPMKKDFILVHLQHGCNHCCMPMVSGTRWVCNQCKDFQLCDECHETDETLEARLRHPIHDRKKHVFYPVEINNVPPDTKDQDAITESKFFDTRHTFLGLCQGNNYQFDSLRRAKHSSMMILYHLHNPTAPSL